MLRGGTWKYGEKFYPEHFSIFKDRPAAVVKAMQKETQWPPKEMDLKADDIKWKPKF